jgi:hypothetical protein
MGIPVRNESNTGRRRTGVGDAKISPQAGSRESCPFRTSYAIATTVHHLRSHICIFLDEATVASDDYIFGLFLFSGRICYIQYVGQLRTSSITTSPVIIFFPPCDCGVLI